VLTRPQKKQRRVLFFVVRNENWTIKKKSKFADKTIKNKLKK